jgi:predicted MFS family arabinose efflux permease
VRALLGDEIEPELRPLLATVVLGFCGVFSFLAYFAIYAVRELDVPAGQVGLGFTAAAAAGVGGAILGGRLSDRVGRRPVIVAAAAGQTGVSALLLLPVGRIGAFAVLAGLSLLQPLRGATQRALVADLARPGRLEQAFAALRIAINTGASGGPLAGAALVTLGWGALHAGTTLVFAGSLLAALRLPVDRASARAGAGDDAGGGVRRLLTDRAFVLVFGATVLAWLVYQAFETLLPVSLAETHSFAPAAWGLVFGINPVLTVLLQLRVTRWARGLRLDAKLVLALALMSLPFLALPLVGAPLALVGVVVVCVTLGEMLWAPASESMVAELAPPDSRGTALGIATAASWLGTASGPALGLQVGAAFGEAAMWGAVVGVATASALLYAIACRTGQLRLGSSGMVAMRRNSPPLRRSTSDQSVSGLSENTSSTSAGSTIHADSSSSASSCPSSQPA